MRSIIDMYKKMSPRVMGAMRPMDIGFLKIFCIALGVLFGAIPGITKGARKYFWAGLALASFLPLTRLLYDAVWKEPKYDI